MLRARDGGARGGRERLEPAMAQLTEALAATDLAGFVEVASLALPPPDRAVLTTAAAADLYADVREGLAQGPEGAVEDELAVVGSWGVEPASVRVPVGLWSGQQDTDTPPGHAEWLAAAIPGASLRRFPEEGHLSLIHRRYREVIDWLGSQAEPRPNGGPR